MSVAAFDDENGQAIDDRVAAVTAGAAEAGRDEFETMVTDGAGHPAKFF